MKANNSAGVWILAGSAFLMAMGTVSADTRENPYTPIVERNPFGLKDPPPPPDPAASLPPPAPPATVTLTGITSIFSKKKALFEITPAPGKQPIKPIMEEGDRVETIELIAIDVDKNQVTIRNNGVLTNVTFTVAKSNPAPAPPPGAGFPGVPATPAPVTTSYVPPTPQAFTPTSVGGRGTVMVTGGAAAQPTPAPAGVTTTFGNPGVTTTFGNGTTTLGGRTVGGGQSAFVTGGGNEANFRSIPSRNIRTDAAAQASQAAVDPAQQYINMRVNEMKSHQDRQFNPKAPPLPPTPPVIGVDVPAPPSLGQ